MEKVMPNWRKAVVIGSLSAGALMFIKGRRPAGIVLATAPASWSSRPSAPWTTTRVPPPPD